MANQLQRAAVNALTTLIRRRPSPREVIRGGKIQAETIPRAALPAPAQSQPAVAPFSKMTIPIGIAGLAGLQQERLDQTPQLGQASEEIIQPEPSAEPQKKEASNGDGEKGSDLFKVLASLGVPLGAAIAGSVNPDILPQAAGLSSGFTEEMLRQQDIEDELKKRQQKVRIFDPDTGDLMGTDKIIDSTDRILRKSSTKENFAENVLSEILGVDTKGKFSETSAAQEGIEKAAEIRSGDREKAIKLLKDNKKPTTEANIQFVIDNQ